MGLCWFKHINYKSGALAEFIDNAIQSFETKNGTFDTRNKCLINIKYDPIILLPVEEQCLWNI